MDDAPTADDIKALVAYEQIRQLASRYAVAVDSRNIEALIELFVDDVRVGGDESGRDALRDAFNSSLSAVGITILQVGTHQIDLIDDDHATGIVYCSAQIHEGDLWINQSILYRDTYERRNGSWHFVRRAHELFHGTPAVTNPLDQEPAEWPSRSFGTGTAPASFPTWNEFWDSNGS